MNNRIYKLIASVGLLLVIAMACQKSEQPKADNSWTNDNLNDKVSRLMEVAYRANNQNGNWIKGQINPTYTVKTYNSSGFLTSERTFYSDSNQPTGGRDYLYDADNNLLRINSVDADGNTVSYSEINERTGKVGILKYTEYYMQGDSATVTGKTTMQWNGHQVISAINFDPNDRQLSTNTYQYDQKGNLTTFTIDNPGDQQDIAVYTQPTEFDDKGNWTKVLREYRGYPVKEVVERKYEYYE